MHRPMLAAAALALVLIAAAHAAGPDPAALVRNYKKLKDLTPQGHQVSRMAVGLCRVMTPPEQAQMRRVLADDHRRSVARFGPHVYATIHVYANPSAVRALKTGVRIFPVDAVLVKVKPGGVTGMIKRSPGYDPKHGDWEYFIQEEGGTLERGKIATCVSCHANAKGPDHVFATWWQK